MTEQSDKIRVAININVLPGIGGGIAQSTQGLVSSLGRLEGPEEYILIANTPDQADWISNYRSSNQHVVIRSNERSPPNGSVIKRVLLPALKAVRCVVGRLSPQRQWPELSVSNGFYESTGCDVLHFPTQSFTLCALPTIFNPHDLQHLHYPQFFSPRELAVRDTAFRAACHFAHTVAVGSEWIKQDVIRQYGASKEKVQVIPWASPTIHYAKIQPAQVEQRSRSLGLPASYALYPAVTWPHKNHLRLLNALAKLRDERGIVVNLICTGARYESHWPKIQQRIKDLNLGSQVRFLGFLSEADLRVVYGRAQFLVLPTLFEADSCPIHEAWSEGLPVASSNHAALPDQISDAGLLFDARDVSAISDAVEKMATNGGLRRELVERGYQRVKDFDWARTAKAYRAVYRRAAGVNLNEEDRWLLQWDWMREPNKSPKPSQILNQFKTR
jgi:glycosyltransferase involved in cell wall biosynthesis